MDTKDVTLPKNYSFKRVTADPKEDMSGLVYTHILKPMLIDTPVSLGQSFENEATLTNCAAPPSVSTQVKSPSEKGRIQILIDLVNDDVGLHQSLSLSILRIRIQTLSTAEELVLKSYGSFARQLVSQDDMSSKHILTKSNVWATTL
jgi:hypothetical protein